jgi:hypothetical protein
VTPALSLAVELRRVLPAWDAGGATGNRLVEQAARQVHLAATRADWPLYESALAAVEAFRTSAEPGGLRELCLHFLPHLHLTGMDTALRAEALKRMPVLLYQEWREITRLLDAMHDGN